MTANPLATKVGMDILRKRGNVVDAGVGVQYVLGLVEPQSSGLGGGSFAIFYHKKSMKSTQSMEGKKHQKDST